MSFYEGIFYILVYKGKCYSSYLRKCWRPSDNKYEGNSTYEGTIERSWGGLVDVHPLREVCFLHFLNRNMSKSHVETVRQTTN